jgi:hypothetical protein
MSETELSEIAARFAAKTERNLSTGCLEWTGARCGQKSQYGAFTWPARRQIVAHRAAWLIVHGEIPDGYEIDHLCRNPICVAIEHLDAVPQIVNWQRGRSVTRMNALKVSCPRGHAYNEANTYTDRRGRRSCRACRREKRAERNAIREMGLAS